MHNNHPAGSTPHVVLGMIRSLARVWHATSTQRRLSRAVPGRNAFNHNASLPKLHSRQRPRLSHTISYLHKGAACCTNTDLHPWLSLMPQWCLLMVLIVLKGRLQLLFTHVHSSECMTATHSTPMTDTPVNKIQAYHCALIYTMLCQPKHSKSHERHVPLWKYAGNVTVPFGAGGS